MRITVNLELGAVELHDFAAAAGLSPPFVLAAHSFAGLIAMMYAATYPDEVCALLLADSAFVDSLPLGKLVESDADHYIPRDIPEEVVTEIELLLGE